MNFTSVHFLENSTLILKNRFSNVWFEIIIHNLTEYFCNECSCMLRFSVKILLFRQHTIHVSYVYNVRWNLDLTVGKPRIMWLDSTFRYFEWAIKTVMLNWSQTHFLIISDRNPPLWSNTVYTIEIHNIPWNVHSIDLEFGIA